MKAKTFLLAILAMLATLGLSAQVARADVITIVDVDGAGSDFLQVDAGESAGIGFTLDDARLGVSITPDFFCLTCTGQLLLMRDVGPGVQLSDLLAAVEFANGFAPALTAGNLDANSYFLVLLVTSGFGGWSSGAGTSTEAGGSYDISLSADAVNTDSTFAGRSNFSALFTSDLFFDVTAEGRSEPTRVPEPSTGLLLLSGLLLTMRRRRSSTSA